MPDFTNIKNDVINGLFPLKTTLLVRYFHQLYPIKLYFFNEFW